MFNLICFVIGVRSLLLPMYNSSDTLCGVRVKLHPVMRLMPATTVTLQPNFSWDVGML